MRQSFSVGIAALDTWVQSIAELCEPACILLCDGSQTERAELTRQLLANGTLIALNPKKRPNSYLCRSDPRDVARVESRTFVCSRSEADAGPSNRWREPVGMQAELLTAFRGCMQGRTLYVIPFSMGPVGSPLARIGVELTDSPYVALSMQIMTRVGSAVLAELEKGADFVRCLHSIGAPLLEGQTDVAWPCNPERTTIAHFPEERAVWSFGSGYGGNALLGKKCFALRLASVMAREEGWLAEHMALLGVTSPSGERSYVAAAFPSACGKTNFAMLVAPPALAGWSVSTLGDDIAWIRPVAGRLRAINPENGMFGVAPGTNHRTNPNAMRAIAADTLFTNVALTDDGDVWWEGMTEEPPTHLIDWRGRDWTPQLREPAAHPNSRFTTPLERCPSLDPNWNAAEGVPLDAIVCGGRMSRDMPLVFQTFDWEHGVYAAATMGSEATAAAESGLPAIRRDPMAMLPFCGYHMADYFAHWLSIGAQLAGPPPIFRVNWFRRDDNGRLLWPGFGDNARVLVWIVERARGRGNALVSPYGFQPGHADLPLAGLELPQAQFTALMQIDATSAESEARTHDELFAPMLDRLPPALLRQRDLLRQRLQSDASNASLPAANGSSAPSTPSAA